MNERRSLRAAVIGGATYALVLGLALLGFLLLLATSNSVGFGRFLPVALIGVLLLGVLVVGPFWLARALGAAGWSLGCIWLVLPFAALLTAGSDRGWILLGLAPGVITLVAMFAADRTGTREIGLVAGVTIFMCIVIANLSAATIWQPLLAGLAAWSLIPMLGTPGSPHSRPSPDSDEGSPLTPMAEEGPGGSRPSPPPAPPEGRRRLHVVAVVGFVIVAGTVSCAGWLSQMQRSHLAVSIEVTGPLYGHVEGEQNVAGYPTPGSDIVGESGYEGNVFAWGPDERNPRGNQRFSYDRGRYTAFFTVTAPGPALITVDSVNEGSGGFLFYSPDEIKGRAIFVVAAPVNAVLRLKGDNSQRPRDLRLEIDRDADGTFDEAWKPDFTRDGEHLDDHGQFRTTATVDEFTPGEARVTLATSGEDTVERTYYWVFPSDPLPREYDGPIVVSEPSYILFASLNRDGNVEVVQEVRALGGAPDITGSIDLESEHVIDFDEPGRIARLTFAGRRDQRIVPRVTASTIGPFPCCSGRMQVLGPGGKALTQETGIGARPSTMETVVLPADGEYTLLVNPYYTYTGDLTVVLDELADVSASVEIDGSPHTLTFEHAEQRGLVTFDGDAGQRVSVVVTIPDSARCCRAAITVEGPAGEALATGEVRTTYEETATLLVDLPDDGVYTVVLDPFVDQIGMLTVSVNGLSDVEQSLTLESQPSKVRIGVPGQLARLTFDGGAGEQIYVVAHDSIAVDEGIGVYFGDQRTRLSVLSPDGATEIARALLVPRRETALAVTLPADGRYVVEVDPPGDKTGTVEVGLQTAVPNSLAMASALPVDGPPERIVIDDPDAIVQRSFAGVEGQLIKLTASNVEVADSEDCCTFWPHFYLPDSDLLASDLGFDLLDFDLDLLGADGMAKPSRLPATGVYVIEFQSYESGTGGFDLSLTSIADVTATVTVGGPPVTIETSDPGQFALVTFTGQRGDVVVSATMAETGRESDWIVNYTIPDAEHSKGWLYAAVHPGWSTDDRFRLTRDGEFTIQFEPSRDNTFSISLSITQLSSTQPTPATGSPLPEVPPPTPEVTPIPIATDGTPAAVSLTHDQGQNHAALSFDAQAGRHLRIDVSITHDLIAISPDRGSNVCCGFEIVVGPADGGEIIETRQLTKGSTHIDVVIPTSGEYLIRLRAIGNSSGQLEVTVRDS